MKPIRSIIQHNLNSVNLYCRLRCIMGKRKAMNISKAWERCRFYHVMYVEGIEKSGL
jgi:hypothetical protein